MSRATAGRDGGPPVCRLDLLISCVSAKTKGLVIIRDLACAILQYDAQRIDGHSHLHSTEIAQQATSTQVRKTRTDMSLLSTTVERGSGTNDWER